MDRTTDQQVQLQENTTEQQNMNRRVTNKKKKTWLVVNTGNDINTYYRFVLIYNIFVVIYFLYSIIDHRNI